MDAAKFEDAYYALLMRAWTSEDFVTELLSDPATALREFGMLVPDGTTVSIVREAMGEGSLEEQHKRWNDGIKAGAVQLVVPDVPPIDVGEISDAELAGMPGGTDYCCCCCPCCSCTA